MEQLPLPAEKASLLSLITWIWHIRGEVPLASGQSADEAFARIDPLFAHSGTTHARMGDVVFLTKKDPLAQDPLSIVDSATLRVEPSGEGSVLRYHLVCRALLYCFLAPLLFLGVAQLTLSLGELAKPTPEEKAKAEAKEKAKANDSKALQLNPVDKFLGAPAPEKPDAEKTKDGKKKDEDEAPKGFSPTPAYVFAGIFAALYVLGRILEAWLIKRRFAKALA